MVRIKYTNRDFPGGPVVKTSPPNAGVTGSISGQGAKIPHASQSKNPNVKQKRYCKTLKMVHIKNIFRKIKHTNRCSYGKKPGRVEILPEVLTVLFSTSH